jgi:hypothetical protein
MTGRPHRACLTRNLVLEYVPRRDAAQRLHLAFGLLLRALADQHQLASERQAPVPLPGQEESS